MGLWKCARPLGVEAASLHLTPKMCSVFITQALWWALQASFRLNNRPNLTIVGQRILEDFSSLQETEG